MCFPARVRKRFDQFAKQSLQALLDPVGILQPETEVISEAQTMDAWFVPDPERVTERRRLGLLGRMAARACLFEPFHAAPSPAAVRACLRKLLTWHHELLRRARVSDARARVALPHLWVLTGGRPTKVLRGFALRRCPGWTSGVYMAAPALHFRVVVLGELPVTRATLPLRLMGAGATLKAAIVELAALSADAWERQMLLPLLARLRYDLPDDPVLHIPNEEHPMRSQEWYETFKRDLQAQGKAEGKAEALLTVCVRRGLALSDQQRAWITATHDVAALERWLDRAITATTSDAIFLSDAPH